MSQRDMTPSIRPDVRLQIEPDRPSAPPIIATSEEGWPIRRCPLYVASIAPDGSVSAADYVIAYAVDVSAGEGRFAAIFAQGVPLPAAHELPPRMSRSAKVLAWDNDLPPRRFEQPSGPERIEHSFKPCTMWVVHRTGPHTVTCTAWLAPDETTYNATRHGDQAPDNPNLFAKGWRRTGGVPVTAKEIGPTIGRAEE